MADINYSTYGKYQDGRNNLFERITDAWKDMRGSTRRLVAEKPSEARLFFYVLLSDLIFFISWSLKTVVSPTGIATTKLPIEIGLWLIAALFCRSFAMYAFSIMLGSLVRVMGGQASWRETRTAVFWGALVASPFGFLCAVITVVLASFEPVFPFLGADWIALPPYWLSLIPFVWFISAGLAEVNGFKRTDTVFGAMAALATAVLFVAMYFRAQGVI